MFWADRLAEEIRNTRKPRDGKRFLIRDEKTLSGRVHVGSMRGVAIHGLIAEVLSEYGIANEYRFELNDFDDFDTTPNYLDQELFKEHLGKPLFKAPSPDPAFANYAEYFGAEFVSVHERAGFRPAYYRAYGDLYVAGKMDPLIRTALERAADVRRIYKAVSGSVKAESWLPITVMCENCGKLRTTSVSDFDGETVAYACNQNPGDTRSCGHTGRIAPWKGNAKLHWKVDWAAKWVANGVDIEGGGKDHSTKGGSRDVANHIAREIFSYEPPFDMPYEFFLVGGKKMSSSKGRGSSAKDMCDLFPPEVFRLAFIGKDIREQIDVDPSGESVPRMYDWYDELAAGVREGKTDDYARLYTLCQLPDKRASAGAPWQMRFREVAFIVQMRHLVLDIEAERAKGSPLTESEKNALEERARYAKFWLTTYAPAEFKYELQKEMPEVTLSQIQKLAMRSLLEFLEVKSDASAGDIHQKLHELKAAIPATPADFFGAIYKIFLNRNSGPKAGWFLAGLPRDFVVKRLQEVA